MLKENKVEMFKNYMDECLNSYVKDYGFPSFKEADPKTKGLVFLKFYLYEIFINFVDIDEDQIENNIVDGKSDIGIDFCYVIDDQVYIIQSKYGKASVTKEALQHFISLPKIIYQEDYVDEKASKEVKSIIKDIYKIKNPHFKLIFITDQKVDDSPFYISECIKNENTDCSILDFYALKEEYSRASSMGDSPPDSVTFNLSNEDFLVLNTVNTEYPTILITQKGSKIKDIYSRYKETLFNYNIRYWLGKNSVNSSMMDTIDNEPERFFILQ